MSGFSIKNNKMHMIFAHRKKVDRNAGYLNRGLYYSFSHTENGFQDKWKAIRQDNEYELPITSIDEFLVDDVSEPGDWYKSPSFDITDDGSIHFIVPFLRAEKPVNFHYCKTKEESTFSRYMLDENLYTMNVDGRLLAVKDKVFLITLYFGRLKILSTPAGTNNFEIAYYNPQGSLYISAGTKIWIENNKYHLFVTAMAIVDERNDQQPIEVFHFLLNIR